METFVKYNSTRFDDALLVEYKGLLQLQKLLEGNNDLQIPKIIEFTPKSLSLQKIQTHAPSEKQMAQLGRGLAKLHAQKFANYGLSYDNYIGLNPQKNIVTKNWGEFFTEQRLGVQIAMVQTKTKCENFTALLKAHKTKISHLLNDTTQHPSFVHGDLWSGNVLFDAKNAYVIDPALYCADREVDIAMSELFGGFSKSFYSEYNATYPLSKEYKTKKVIYNLYHFLNHYNLFGDSYVRECQDAFTFIEQL